MVWRLPINQRLARPLTRRQPTHQPTGRLYALHREPILHYLRQYLQRQPTAPPLAQILRQVLRLEPIQNRVQAEHPVFLVARRTEEEVLEEVEAEEVRAVGHLAVDRSAEDHLVVSPEVPRPPLVHRRVPELVAAVPAAVQVRVVF